MAKYNLLELLKAESEFLDALLMADHLSLKNWGRRHGVNVGYRSEPWWGRVTKAIVAQKARLNAAIGVNGE